MTIPDISVPIGNNIHNNKLIQWGTNPIDSHLLVNSASNKDKTSTVQSIIKHLDDNPIPKKILYYSSDTDAQEEFIANRVLPYENIRYYDSEEEVLLFREAYDLMNSRTTYFETHTYHYKEKNFTPVFLVIDDYNSLSKISKQHVSNFVRFGRVARIKVIASYNPQKKNTMPEETRLNFNFQVHCFENKPIIGIEHYTESFIAVPDKY